MTDTTIAQLKQDSHNRRKHNPRNIGMIVNALQEVGAARSIVIDEDNNILAGNGTIEAAQLAGIERMKIVEADGEEIIAVRRRGLTDEQKRRLAILDNRSAELADWDIDQLLADVDAGLDFDGIFGKAELDELLKDVRSGDEDAEPQIDKAAELQEKWQTATGQLWACGEHKIICGDCTDKAVVERVTGGEKAQLCITDPPYGLSDTKSFNNDHPDYEDEEPFDLTLLDLPALFVIFGGNYYDWLPMKRNKIGWIVWDKRPDLEGEKRERADRRFGQHFEIAVTNIGDLRGKIYRQRWEGYYGSTEILHKTQKPVELFEWCIKSTEGIIIDYFLGSGTTLIACQNLGRRCRAVEISPAYVAVSLQRFQDATSITPTLIES